MIRLAAALLLGLAPEMPALLGAQQPVPAGRVTAGRLAFDGHANVGDFTGVTDSVRGEQSGGASLAEVHGWAEAPATSLRTGNGRRDRDMNSSLESDKYPTIRFDLDHLVPDDPRVAGDSVGAMLEGALTIHGVRRPVTVPARVIRTADGLRLRSDFALNLKDYGIGGLTKLLGVLRMDEHIAVHVDLLFADR